MQACPLMPERPQMPERAVKIADGRRSTHIKAGLIKAYCMRSRLITFAPRKKA
jgi:hypothetical protein